MAKVLKFSFAEKNECSKTSLSSHSLPSSTWRLRSFRQLIRGNSVMRINGNFGATLSRWITWLVAASRTLPLSNYSECDYHEVLKNGEVSIVSQRECARCETSHRMENRWELSPERVSTNFHGIVYYSFVFRVMNVFQPLRPPLLRSWGRRDIEICVPSSFESILRSPRTQNDPTWASNSHD